MNNKCIPIYIILFCIYLLSAVGCSSGKPVEDQDESTTYKNPIFPAANSYVYLYEGIYYHVENTDDEIIIRRTKDLTDLQNAERKVARNLVKEDNLHHLWGPQIIRIGSKWYIYFAGDDGNTDNHQIYVIENESDDPFEGEFKFKGRISTDPQNNWAIQPNVFEHRGELYMTWSGWETKRLYKETQCIYIARMSDPLTLVFPRIMISQPEYEWERQWVNPDGSKFGYPVYVNEAPFFFKWNKSDDVYIFYSASASWTSYYCSGRLTAKADSDLLNPLSWRKSPRPVFMKSEADSAFCTGECRLVSSLDSSEYYLLYTARIAESYAEIENNWRAVRMQPIGVNEDGSPDLGKPVSLSKRLKKPAITVN